MFFILPVFFFWREMLLLYVICTHSICKLLADPANSFLPKIFFYAKSNIFLLAQSIITSIFDNKILKLTIHNVIVPTYK